MNKQHISSNRHHVLDVLSYILSKIEKKEPMSLLRLGDAEGRFLGYPEFVKKEGAGGDRLDFVLQLELGRTDFSCDELKALSVQMRQAVINADIIGLPRVKQCEKDIAYRYVFEAIDRFGLLRSDVMRCDAAIHRYLQFGLFYQYLLQDKKFVGVITGRSELGSIVKKIFKVEEVRSYLIPAEAIHPGELGGEHFPDRFYSLKQELVVPYQGAVFLVGAGYLGKIYCQWIKQKGGIAIDIGSICDSWTSKGRLQHDYHKIKHYISHPNLTMKERIGRFNQACDNFSMDTHRLIPEEWQGYQTK